MPTTELEFHYEVSCEHCGETKMTENRSEFTVSVAQKEEYGMHLPTDHDCEFTEFYELSEPEVVGIDDSNSRVTESDETVEYDYGA